MSQRKDERIEQFEENYHQAVEDLSAREGLGPVHGAARRAVQETIRTGAALAVHVFPLHVTTFFLACMKCIRQTNLAQVSGKSGPPWARWSE